MAQGQNIGPMLVKLEKVPAVLVEEGEVGGGDNRLRPDYPVVGNRPARGQFQHLCVLKNLQSLNHSGGKFQRMELSLTGKAHCPRHGEGEGQIGGELGGEAQPLQSGQLPVQLFPVLPGVDIGVPLLKIAGDVPAQGAVLLQRRLVALQVKPGPFHAEFTDELVVNQPVLKGDFCRGIFGGPAAEPVRLHEGAADPCAGELISAEDTGHSPADNQHVCVQIPWQGAELGQLRSLCPN